MRMVFGEVVNVWAHTERDSLVNGHWVLDGFVIEGEHAMERVYECVDLER